MHSPILKELTCAAILPDETAQQEIFQIRTLRKTALEMLKRTAILPLEKNSWPSSRLLRQNTIIFSEIECTLKPGCGLE